MTKRKAVVEGLPAEHFATFKAIITAMITEVTRP